MLSKNLDDPITKLQWCEEHNAKIRYRNRKKKKKNTKSKRRTNSGGEKSNYILFRGYEVDNCVKKCLARSRYF